MFCAQSVSRYEGRSPPTCQGSPCTRGHGVHTTHALSPHSTIGKEHRSVTPTRPTTRILTPRKVIIQRQLLVPLSSSDDDLPLAKYDAQADLNPGGARILYTQEPALLSDSPPSSLLPYIMLGQRVGVGPSKVLIPNTKYKGKGHTMSVIPHSEKEGTKPPYVCPGCSNHTHGNN
jgi:hypothetical protein